MKERIKTIQSTTKMSQQDFAKAIGVAPGSLSSVYSGRTQPTNNYVLGIHKAFPEINLYWLMFGEGDMYVESPEESSSSHPTMDDGSQHDGGEASLFNQPEQSSDDVLPFGAPRMSSSQRPPIGGAHDFVSTPQTTQAMPFVTAKDFDFKTRRIKEIRVFFDDGTYESFQSSK